MKIKVKKPVVVSKAAKPKKKVVIVASDDDEDLALNNPRPGHVKAVRKIVVSADQADDEVLEELEQESGEFLTEFNPERIGQRRPGKVIDITALDPDRVYGVEFVKKGTYARRQIRPATGLELRRRWSELLDYAIVQYFPSSSIRRGFRILQCPNQVCIGICDWRGPAYTPDTTELAKKRRIRFRR